jgi:hypothetical protein
MHVYAPPCALAVDDELIPLRRPTAVLTPRGVVAAQIVSLEYQLADLSPSDRTFCLDLLRQTLDEAGVGA